MLSKKVKHKNNLIIFILRLLFGLLIFDEKNILLKKRTQKYFFIPHYLERLYELLHFYPLSLKRFINIIKKYGYPTSEVYKLNFNKLFLYTGKDNLFNSYRKQDLVYTTRLMLCYNRVYFISPYLKLINRRGIKTVLDYGCGVSDIGLLLSKLGCDLSLVDLDLPKLYFTKQRFIWRKLPVKIYPVDNTEKLANISEKYDLIIATEIIEHYRYPIKMINYFYDRLNNDGLLLLTIGKSFKKEKGGDHLDEAFEEGSSPEYWNNFNKKFKPVDGKFILFNKV